MKNIAYKSIITLLLLFVGVNVFGQTKNKDILDYIDKYHKIAIKEMNTYKIPASITLAQGIFESGWGKSSLAMKSNNHFGIKCKSSWDGMKVYHDDDAIGECFRKYDSVEDSYEDHSKFLVSNTRYASLFHLKTTDYKGWSEGLKKAGYATNPQYASRLINLIELYELHQYDTPLKHKKEPIVVTVIEKPKKEVVDKKEDTYIIKKGVKIYSINKSKYIIAENGDTWDLIAVRTGKKINKLYLFNDITDPNYSISEGERIYITKKQKKYTGSDLQYFAQEGETLHSISQKFGIVVAPLCDINSLYKFEKLSKGKVIELRK